MDYDLQESRTNSIWDVEIRLFFFQLYFFLQVLRQWHNRRSCEVKMFIIKLLEWQKAGYVSADVWTDIEELINKNLLPSEDEISGDSMSSVDDRKLNTDTSNDDPPEPDVDEDKDQQMKLQKSDLVNERVLLRAADNVFPSRRRQLALGPLKLGEREYERLLQEKDDSLIRNFKVVVP